MRPFFIEFMDLRSLWPGLRNTLRETLETADSWPFRNYYRSTVQVIQAICERLAPSHVIELGAGSAPLTRLLSKAALPPGTRLIVCDYYPDVACYERLKHSSRQSVDFISSSVDFRKPYDWPEGALLVLSSTLHHVPFSERAQVLSGLVSRSNPVLVTESIRHNWKSFFMCLLGGPLAVLVTPLVRIGQPGRLRRCFWCWCTPVAMFCFVWDGLVSVWRCWSEKEWADWAAAQPRPPDLVLSPRLASLFVRIQSSAKSEFAQAAAPM